MISWILFSVNVVNVCGWVVVLTMVMVGFPGGDEGGGEGGGWVWCQVW